METKSVQIIIITDKILSRLTLVFSRSWSWRWWPKTQHGLALVELRGIVSKITPYSAHLRSHSQRHGGVYHGDETIQARQTVGSGEVRRALRQGVDPREGGAAIYHTHTRGEPPGCRDG